MLIIIAYDMIEQAAIDALQKQHSYTVLRCYAETPEALPDETGRTNKRQVVLPQVSLDSLCRINLDISTDTVHAIAEKLCHASVSGDLMLTNFGNYQRIRNEIAVEYTKNGHKTSDILHLIDFSIPENNSFKIKSRPWDHSDTAPLLLYFRYAAYRRSCSRSSCSTRSSTGRG